MFAADKLVIQNRGFTVLRPSVIVTIIKFMVETPLSWLFRMNNRIEEEAATTEGPLPIPGSMALSICSDLAIKYLEKETFQDYLHQNHRYLIYGKLSH